MFLHHLNILQFKNIEEKSFEFHRKIVALVGNNATGKTNVLDAIHYLSMTKSYFSSNDSINIQHNKDYFVLFGKFENNTELIEVSCSVKKNNGKQVFLNQKPYQKLSDHIGKIPIVVIAPQDLSLITDYAETRRKFVDILLSKFDKEYLQALIQYQTALQNRNTLLKQGEIIYSQQDLVDIYNFQLVQFGSIILQKRISFFNEIKETLSSTYQLLQDNQEVLELKYVSTIHNDFLKELQQSLSKDIRMGYTTVGIHRDDFEITVNQYPAKNFASQGQQKTIIFALKWIELLYIFQKTNIQPILLVDDIYDRLDEKRIGKMLYFLLSNNVGQVFLTDTHLERILKLFEGQELQVINM